VNGGFSHHHSSRFWANAFGLRHTSHWHISAVLSITQPVAKIRCPALVVLLESSPSMRYTCSEAVATLTTPEYMSQSSWVRPYWQHPYMRQHSKVIPRPAHERPACDMRSGIDLLNPLAARGRGRDFMIRSQVLEIVRSRCNRLR
jgi:hypothetical protein